MSVTEDAAADRRWAAAQSIADGVMDDRMPRRRRIVWFWISALIIGSWALGLVLTLVLPHSPGGSDSHNDGASTRQLVGLAFQFVGFLIILGGFIWSVRTKRYVTRWRSVASPLNIGERAWVQKQIRTSTPVEDDRKRSVVLAMAAQNRRVTIGGIPLLFGLTVLALGTGVASRWEAVLWFELFVVLAFIVAFAFAARDYRRSGRYLDRFAQRPPVTGSAD